MDAGSGFEPELSESKSLVLPLDDPADVVCGSFFEFIFDNPFIYVPFSFME